MKDMICFFRTSCYIVLQIVERKYCIWQRYKNIKILRIKYSLYFEFKKSKFKYFLQFSLKDNTLLKL